MQHLESILDTLDRLFPGFHTALDRADLTEARAAIDDVARRLERDIAREEALYQEDPLRADFMVTMPDPARRALEHPSNHKDTRT